MFRRSYLTLLSWALLLTAATTAFVPTPQHKQRARAALPLQASSSSSSSSLQQDLQVKIAAATTFVMVNFPTIAMAVVEDDYEYGKVDAPIGLAVGGGLLAILTALLPIALKGGEEAFEEIREREKDTFGGSNKDVLKKRK